MGPPVAKAQRSRRPPLRSGAVDFGDESQCEWETYGGLSMHGEHPNSDTVSNMFLAWVRPVSPAEVSESVRAFVGEYHAFVTRRIQDNFGLMQRLSECRTTSEAMTAYADYWNKAADDCGKEVTILTKLVLNHNGECNAHDS